MDNRLTIEMDGRMSATYMFAGVAVRITSVYTQIHRMCADYVTEKAPEIVVSVTQADIDKEYADSIADMPEASNHGNLETLVVYRKMALQLLDYDVLLMHGSCVAVDGKAHIFTAVSGTGKSTHVRLWRELLGDRAVMVNDDKPLIRIAADGMPTVYGTPWDGKHHLSTNIAVPLQSIIQLERGEDNEIHEITPHDIFPTLLQQTFHTSDPEVTLKVMDLLSRLAAHLRFYNLHCNMDPAAAKVASTAIL